MRTTSRCSAGSSVQGGADSFDVFEADESLIRPRRLGLRLGGDRLDRPAANALLSLDDDRFVERHAKEPALERFFAGRVAAFDDLRERRLQHVAGRIVIAKNAVDETTQLVGMFQEQRRDDAGIELRFVGESKAGRGRAAGRANGRNRATIFILSPAAVTMKPR